MTLTNPFARFAAAVVAVSLLAGIAFTAVAPRAEAASLTSAQVQSIISLLQSFGADAATIANVQASLTGGTPTPTPGGGGGACPTLTRSIQQGASGADVKALQVFLNGYSSDTRVAVSGAGSPGSESTFFGPATHAAVVKFQAKNNVSPIGIVGPQTRAAITAVCGTVSVPGTPAPTGTGLSVMAGAAIANGLSPQGATRVPFTNFNVTAGNDGDVVINSVTVQRTGFGQDAAFAGVILVDLDSGKQLGTAKTFNSNHQANVGEVLTVARGTTRHFQIAGNMASSLLSYAGEAPSLSVVGINTSATVTGSLPISGAFNTNNATLTVGSMTLSTSNAFAANSNATKEIGTVAYKTTGFRLTAGSSEDVRLKSIRWNQAGSASSNDIANVMTYVNGVGYPTTVTSDGRYYDTNLGAGVVIPKGNQIEVYVQYDIIGSNSSNRSVIFDIDKTTDIYGTGEVYGYGISPAAGSSSVPTSRGTITVTSGTPFIYSTQVTISGASITTIGKANEVPAQNIAINLPNQPLGGYVVDIKGEEVTVARSVFTIASTTGSGTGLLTNLTIVDENGAVVAGPVDAEYTSALVQTATFSDTITYKTGRHVYTVRGKVSSSIGNGGTYIVTTVPSSGWTTVRGVTTGNSVSLASNGTFSMNTMTVKTGAVQVGRAPSPASQTITPGGQGVLMSNIQVDATQSGEDVRFSSVPVAVAVGGSAAVTSLTACQIFDGTLALNTGSSVLNPSSTASSTVSLDNPVTVAKGSTKTLGLRCNVSGSASNGNTFMWDIADAASWTFTGATSGTTITGTDASDTAATFTIGAGAGTVTQDASAPSYVIAASNTAGNVNNVFKFRATNEDINLAEIGLSLGNTASSSASDLVKVTLWDGATKVGEAFFTGAATNATSTLTSTVVLPKNTDKVITVKVDLANVGTGEAVTFSGHLVAVNFASARGVGAQSGTSTYVTGSAASNGIRVMKSKPTFALDTSLNGASGLADGRLMRFTVTADAAGPVGITQFAVNLATTTVTLNNVTIYGFTDSTYSTPISGVQTSGDLQVTDDTAVAANVVIGVTNAAGTASAIQIPAGATRYFEVRASVSGDATGAAVTTKVLGSTSFPSTSAGVSANPLLAASASGVSSSDNVLVWSPNSTTTATRSDQDWTNGYGVSGLPGGGLIGTRSH